jgi:hypothetical protein
MLRVIRSAVVSLMASPLLIASARQRFCGEEGEVRVA